METKFVLAAYDIVENSIRNKLIDVLFYYGMERIQYSVFIGHINETHFDRMVDQIYDEFEQEDAKILIIELCKGCFKKAISINYDLPLEKPKHIVI